MKHYNFTLCIKTQLWISKAPCSTPPPPPPQPSPTEVVTSQDNTVKFSLEILNPHIAPFVIRLTMLGIIDNK